MSFGSAGTGTHLTGTHLDEHNILLAWAYLRKLVFVIARSVWGGAFQSVCQIISKSCLLADHVIVNHWCRSPVWVGVLTASTPTQVASLHITAHILVFACVSFEPVLVRVLV